MPLRTESMTGLVGTQVTFVGFGSTDSGGSGLGIKRQVTVDIHLVHTYGFFNVVEGATVKNTCNGDSGGPGLVKLGVVEQVAGVVSAGDSDCVSIGWSTRLDLHIGWILSMADQYDPGSIDTGTCGDGACAGGDNSHNCPNDCGETAPDGGMDAGGEAGVDSGSGGGDAGADAGGGRVDAGPDAGPTGDDVGPDAGHSADSGSGAEGVCGDGVCGGGETAELCPDDCGEGGKPACAGGACGGEEESSGCATVAPGAAAQPAGLLVLIPVMAVTTGRLRRRSGRNEPGRCLTG
jgi:hypothetical protein